LVGEVSPSLQPAQKRGLPALSALAIGRAHPLCRWPPWKCRRNHETAARGHLESAVVKPYRQFNFLNARHSRQRPDLRQGFGDGGRKDVYFPADFCAAIAQLDRAPDYESDGWQFDSVWPHHMPLVKSTSYERHIFCVNQAIRLATCCPQQPIIDEAFVSGDSALPQTVGRECHLESVVFRSSDSYLCYCVS
jgi:hypothetical protein